MSASPDNITIPDAPPIDGLSFRRFRGDDDFALMVDVINATKAADGVERTPTAARIANFYRHRPTLDLARDIVYAEVGGLLIGYDAVFWNLNSQDEMLYWQIGFVRPEWRRRGLGRALLRAGERRLREIAATHPTETPKLFEIEVADTQVGKEALLRSEAYTPARHSFVMLRSLDEPVVDAPLPAGLRLQPVVPQQYEAIRLASNEAFKDSLADSPADPETFQAWLEAPDFRPDLWVVAWDGDEIAGMALNDIHTAENQEYGRRRGWTHSVGTRRPWRGRGLASALLAESLKRHAAAGMTEVGLDVDTENTSGALRLYERVGFHPIKRHSLYRKPLD